MSETFNLLRQIRNALQKVSGETQNREHQALLYSADVVLNELMLRTDTAFYTSYIAEGTALAAEGWELLQWTDRSLVRDLPDAPDASTSMDVICEAIDRLSRALVTLVKEVDETSSNDARSYVERVCAWEAELYSHSLHSANARLEAEPSPFTQAAFQTYLENRFPEWTNLKITSFAPLTGGFSKRTILFETQDDVNGQRTLILRAEQTVSLPRFSDVTQEFHLINFTVESALPTPAALWLETDLSHFGKPFLVMEKAEGNNYGVTMGRKESVSDELLRSIIDTLCAMHNVVIQPDDPSITRSHLAEWTPYATIAENSRYYVTHYLPKLMQNAGVAPTPELARALKWLENNAPTIDARPVLVHVDFGLNNLLIEGDRVTAILDWESARLGDPCEDILVIQRELADYISMEEFLERYRAGTGRAISAYNLAYARVAAFAIYMIVYLNGRQKLIHDARTPIAMSLLAFNFIAGTASQLNDLIAHAESLRER